MFSNLESMSKKYANLEGQKSCGTIVVLLTQVVLFAALTPESHAVFAVEFVHPASRIQDLLFAGIKRMAQGTHFYVQITLEG